MNLRSPASLRLLTALFCVCVMPALHAASPAKKKAPEVRGTKVNGVYDGPVEIWTNSTTKQAAGSFSRGQPDGPWTFWDSGGTKIVEVTYLNGTFSGKVTMWQGTAAGPRDRGKLKMRGAFDDGMWQGSILTYYPDGRSRSERVYKDNELTGAYAYTPKGKAMKPAQAERVAIEDERIDNRFVDSLDNYIRKWAVRPAPSLAKAD